MRRTIKQLKSWFSKGKIPTASQFSDLIDSFYHKDEVYNHIERNIFIVCNFKGIIGTLESLPEAPDCGDMYFITSEHKSYCYKGSEWKDMSNDFYNQSYVVKISTEDYESLEGNISNNNVYLITE